jgi:hypothetical protein
VCRRLATVHARSGIKTPEQAAICGVAEGERYDQRCHLACDDFFNNSNRALDPNADAAVHVLITLAQSKIPDRPAAELRQQRSGPLSAGPAVASPTRSDAPRAWRRMTALSRSAHGREAWPRPIARAA